MSRKIHLTESQIEEIVDKLNEDADNNVVNYTPDTFGGDTSVDNALDVAIKTKQNFPNKNVYAFNTELELGNTDKNQLKQKIRQGAQQVLNGVVGENKTYSKKQIKEAKLRYLKEHSTAYSKKDFKNRFIKN